MTDGGNHGRPELRASDADRDRIAAVLREHCGEGRLTLDELSERLEATFSATSQAELDRLVSDLPAGPSQASTPAQASMPAPPVRRRSPTSWTVSIMGMSSRRGRWRPGRNSYVVALMGSCIIDLRKAQVEGPELVITAYSIMGDVQIIVPEGIDVDLTGVPIMGTKDLKVGDAPPVRGMPGLRVRAVPIMGSVEVRSKGERQPSSGELQSARQELRSARQELRSARHERHRERPARRRDW